MLESAEKQVKSDSPDFVVPTYSPASIDAFLAAYPAAHFVLPFVGVRADGQKVTKPTARGWQNKAPHAPAVQAHVLRPSIEVENTTCYPVLGIIPQSVCCFVIDVDEGAAETAHAVQAEFPAAWVFPSRRAGQGFHVWLPIEVEQGRVSNPKWAGFGGGGDSRCGTGFLFLWYSLDKLRESLAAVDHSYKVREILPHFPGVKAKAKARGDYTPGNRNNDLNEGVFDAARNGQPARIEAECQAALDAGLPEGEVVATAASAKAAGEAVGASVFHNFDAWALGDALDAMGVGVRYDVRGAALQIRAPGADWQNLTDRRASELRTDVGRRFSYVRSDNKRRPLLFQLAAFVDGCGAIASKRNAEVDPFMVYLEALPAWDETRRLGDLLYRALGVQPDDLGTWASIYPYLGAVQRTYEPGCRIKESPVYIGPQRFGKSPYLEAAFPPPMREAWFSDALAYNQDAKKMIESTLGKVVVEFAELSAVRVYDREALKSYLSAPVDRTRLAYARMPEALPRRFVLVFTSNQEQCLPPDPSGYSRFVPVTCTHGSNVEALLDVERPQLWSEALWLYRQGERAGLPRELYGAQERATDAARATDSLEDQVADLDAPGEWTLAAIGARLNLADPLPKPLQNRLAEALAHKGWLKRHTENGNVWRRPQS